MGGLFFAVYTNEHTINIDFTKSFFDLKSRGEGRTEFIRDSSASISGGNGVNGRGANIQSMLSKQEIADYTQYNFLYGYHRSVINDHSLNASQPFEFPMSYKIYKYPELKNVSVKKLLCNGEIYNYPSIVSENSFGDKDLCSTSDVEVIIPLYKKLGIEDTFQLLNGDFACILTDNTNTWQKTDINIYAARDKLGIRPLYMITNDNQSFILFISELKGIPAYCKGKGWTTYEVPIGTMWSFQDSVFGGDGVVFRKWSDLHVQYAIENCIYNTPNPSTLSKVYNILKNTLESAVSMRIPSNGKVGIFLSDGLNSSLLASILAKSEDKTITAITFGTDTGNDLLEYFNKEQFPSNITKYSVDSNTVEIPSIFDTIVPEGYMGVYLMLKYAKQLGVKIILYGGFLDGIFKNCQNECINYLTNLHLTDLKILDNLSGLFDIELRYPFLDKEFIDVVMKIHPNLKKNQIYNSNKPPISKYLLRRSFNSGYLPDDILWKIPEKLKCEYSTY